MFASVARQYLELGLCVIPCHGKKPALRWTSFQERPPTIQQIEAWSRKHSSANIGTVTGSISGLTVVDIDSPDYIETAISIFGDTPLKAQTPRGGMHLYFSYSGERSVTGINRTPVDIRGQGGFIVLPPSVNSELGNAYSLVSGDYSMLGTLPAARGILNQKPSSKHLKPAAEIAWGEIVGEGQRNDALFTWLRAEAFKHDDIEELMESANATNNLMLLPPLPTGEVEATVKSVWGYKLAGNLKRPGQQFATLDSSEIDGLMDKPRAFQLLAFLKKTHDGLRPEFKVMDIALAGLLGWSSDTVEDARHILLTRGYLKLVYQGGRRRGDASLYRFP
jgi:hypothetical protein